MTVCQNKDLLSKIQSSYLWEADEQQLDNLIVSTMIFDSRSFQNKTELLHQDVPTEDLNICNGLQQATYPRFNTILERSQITSSMNFTPKETTVVSLSEMYFKSSEEVKSRAPWTPTSMLEENSQIPMIEPEESLRSASVAK